MTIEPGRRIGNYHIEQHLGSGAFATVWFARDVMLDAPVAIKVLADNWARDPEIRGRFIDEAKLLRRLDDDHVVRVFAVDQAPDGRPFFVMAFADRGTLQDRMVARSPQGPWAVADAVAVVMELASCLEVVHDIGVVHRDLKPSNVLFRSVSSHVGRRLGRDERAVLGDFGLAKDLVRASGFTMAAGTPAYMAPEQTRSSTQLDHRADLYSATAILFELLAGRPPVDADTMSGRRHATDASADVMLRELAERLPNGLVAVLRQGLAPHPNDRFASASEMIERLRPLLETSSASSTSGVALGAATNPAAPGGAGASSGGGPSGALTGVRPGGADDDGADDVRDRVSSVVSLLPADRGGPLRAALWRPFSVAVIGSSTATELLQSAITDGVVASRTTDELPPSGSAAEMPDAIAVVLDDDPQVGGTQLDQVVAQLRGDVIAPVAVVGVVEHSGQARDQPVPAAYAGSRSESMVAVLAPLSDPSRMIEVLERVSARHDAIRASAVLTLIERLANDMPSGSSHAGRSPDLAPPHPATGSGSSESSWAHVLDRIDGLRAAIPEFSELDVVRDEVAGRLPLPAPLRTALRNTLLFGVSAEASPTGGRFVGAGVVPSMTREVIEEELATWRRYQNSGRASFAARTAVEVVITALERRWSSL